MIYRNLLALVLSIVSLTAMAQYTTVNSKAQKLYEQANNHITFQRFDDAEKCLKSAIKKDPSFAEAYYQLASVYRKKDMIDLDLATLKACAELNGRQYIMSYFYWATELLDLGYYAEAAEQLELLRKSSNLLRDSQRQMVEYFYKQSLFGIHQMKNPVPFDPKNMGPNINTKDDDYHPSLNADESVFIVTTNLPTMSDAFGMRLQEDFFISKKAGSTWSPREPMGPPLNTIRNEGTMSMTADGSMFFFSACDRPDGLGSCDIYYSEKIGNKWTTPKNLNRPINTRYWEAQPSVSADGRTLYFVSNRPGGYGASDIWVSTMNDFGEWTNPRNAGDQINTDKEESNPFIHADNNTFYFCSSGLLGMGGSDIFVTRRDAQKQWGKPVNFGYPINTKDNETGIMVSAQGNTAYFASDRFEGFGGLDIYSFELNPEVQPQPVSYVSGHITDANTGKNVSAVIELVDLETSELMARSFSDPVNGTYLVVLPAGRKYAFNAAKGGYLFYSEAFDIPEKQEESMKMDIELQPIAAGVKMVLNNVFFDTDSYSLKNESKIELDKLIAFMRQNQRAGIEVGGHTDDRGNATANKKLSENRAKAVYDYLVSQLIDSKRITYKGYGMEMPVMSNDTDENRAKNRRTEIMIISN